MFIYVFMYTPSNQHFKAFFPVSKINSETSFLYQLFKENSNFMVFKPCKVFSLSIFYYYYYSFIYGCIYKPLNQHFKAFPVSKINSETSFLYQLFKENSNFIVLKPCTFTFFYVFFIIFIIIHEFS